MGGITAYNQGKSTGEIIGKIILGGFVGLAVGGLVLASIGVVATIFGSAGLATSVWVFGMTAKEVFIIGAVTYNVVGALVAPIIGMEMQLIEWGNPSYKPEKPWETPKHPSQR